MKFIYLLLIPLFTYSIELKIATYNVDNLFDNINNSTEYNDYILNTHNWNSVTFKKKIENITRVICDLNADVLALEEVENRNALNSLLKNLNRSGCKYRYSAITHKKGSAIQIALISKVKLNSIKEIIVSPNKSDRNILEVTLDTKPKLTIFANHWRSKRAPESARVKYAKALIKRIKKMPKGSEYIILGDFNSNYNECINISSKNNNTNGICGIDTILKTYYKGALLKLRDKVNNSYHYNLWSEIEPHKRWSHDFYGKKGTLDSIIIPTTLNDNRGWFYKSGSFKVFKKRYLFKKKRNTLFVWEYKNSKHTGNGYSDHLPIYAYFSNKHSKELKHETMLDKFWKLFIPKVEDNKTNIKELNLATLAKWKYIKNPVILNDACIVFKRGDTAIIKSSPSSLPITLYKCAEGLKEGSCYKLKVYKKKKYYGIDEILDIEKIEEYKTIDINKYIKKFDINTLKNYNIGDIVKDIKGKYKEHYLYINNTKIRLFVKQKRKGLLRKNSNLYIKKAQIGYYKGEKELIVYSYKDIKKDN